MRRKKRGGRGERGYKEREEEKDGKKGSREEEKEIWRRNGEGVRGEESALCSLSHQKQKRKQRG